MKEAIWNLSAKATRRLLSVHKPFVRMARQRSRAAEQEQFRKDAQQVEREIAAVAAGRAPIIAGPWLSEVGYEVLYWLPFLRWFTDKYRIAPERLVAVSRGGVRDWYAGLAGRYVEIFDQMPASELAARNLARQAHDESGGQKQSALGSLDEEILARARGSLGISDAHTLHPSLLFRLFRHVWFGNLPLDFFWTHTRYERREMPAGAGDLPVGLPPKFIAAKFYSGTALPLTDEHRAIVRALVARTAATMPVISLDADYGVDEHRDFDLTGIPNVTSARAWMTARDNLALQSRLLDRASGFIGTCGGLAWRAPFVGVPTTAVYADDQLLRVHLMIAKQAGAAAGAAEFTTLDLRALQRIGLSLEDSARIDSPPDTAQFGHPHRTQND